MTNGAMAASRQTGSWGPVSGGDERATEEAEMPLFMDVHTISGGVSIEAVARAMWPTSRSRLAMMSGTYGTGSTSAGRSSA
jgi:hypothetical protein